MNSLVLQRFLNLIKDYWTESQNQQFFNEQHHTIDNGTTQRLSGFNSNIYKIDQVWTGQDKVDFFHPGKKITREWFTGRPRRDQNWRNWNHDQRAGFFESKSKTGPNCSIIKNQVLDREMWTDRQKNDFFQTKPS